MYFIPWDTPILIARRSEAAGSHGVPPLLRYVVSPWKKPKHLRFDRQLAVI